MCRGCGTQGHLEDRDSWLHLLCDYIVRSGHSPSVHRPCTRHSWTSIVAPPRVRYPSGENT